MPAAFIKTQCVLTQPASFQAREAWAAGSKPIKAFMVDQIIATKHQEYLESLYDYAVPPTPAGPRPASCGPRTCRCTSWRRPTS